MMKQATMQGPMIEVRDLTFTYGNTVALQGVSFQMPRGEIFGLLGPNGAGKSTLIKILATLLPYDSGWVRINGLDPQTDYLEIRRELGVVFQEPSLDERLSVFENLHFHARLYHIPGREIRARVEQALQLVDLLERKNERVFNLSGGLIRRLEIARGLLHAPKLVFLDEPTIGLDPQTRRRIWDYIRQARQERGVSFFLTTHYMEEAEICQRIAIIDRGEIIALDSPANLKSAVGDIIRLRTLNDQEAKRIIQQQFGIEAELEEPGLRIQVPDGPGFLPRLLASAGLQIERVDVQKATLEDVFIQLTGRAIAASHTGMPKAMPEAAQRAENRAGAGNLKNVVKSRRLY